jgi:alanine dehydrogenase
VTLADVRGEIGEVIAGQREGRRNDDEIVVFDSTGTAVQDTAPAAALYLAMQNAPTADLWAMN